MAAKYIKIFCDWLETTAMLKPSEKGRLIDALISYANGLPYEVSGKVAILFPSFKGQVDRDMESYEQLLDASRKGVQARKRKRSNRQLTDGEPTVNQDKDKDKDKDTTPSTVPPPGEPAEAAAAEAAEDPLYSPGWKRVVDAYHRELGGLPTGTALEIFASYVADLGPDAVIVAIRKTNEAQPNNPWRFLKAILDKFADANVRSESEAIALCNVHERQRSSQQKVPAKPEPEVKWLV